MAAGDIIGTHNINMTDYSVVVADRWVIVTMCSIGESP